MGCKAQLLEQYNKEQAEKIILFERYVEKAKSLEFNHEDLCIIAPNSMEDIVEEQRMQRNCVASYIDRMARGECLILFGRKTSNISKSYLTIEVRGKRVVQIERKGNTSPSNNDMLFINKWKQSLNLM